MEKQTVYRYNYLSVLTLEKHDQLFRSACKVLKNCDKMPSHLIVLVFTTFLFLLTLIFCFSPQALMFFAFYVHSLFVFAHKVC